MQTVKKFKDKRTGEIVTSYNESEKKYFEEVLETSGTVVEFAKTMGIEVIEVK